MCNVRRGVSSLIECLKQWLAANMVVSSFAIGALAITVFQLGFVDALLTVLFINLLGITPVCFFSTFGPRYGLRQMVLSRYFFGYYGVKVSKYIPIVRRYMDDPPHQKFAKRIKQSHSSISLRASDGPLSTSS